MVGGGIGDVAVLEDDKKILPGFGVEATSVSVLQQEHQPEIGRVVAGARRYVSRCHHVIVSAFEHQPPVHGLASAGFGAATNQRLGGAHLGGGEARSPPEPSGSDKRRRMDIVRVDLIGPMSVENGA